MDGPEIISMKINLYYIVINTLVCLLENAPFDNKKNFQKGKFKGAEQV